MVGWSSQIRRHTRRRFQRGSYLIEATLITLLMFGLLFLLIDICLLLFTNSTLQNAVREGARFAVTEQLASGQNYLNDSVVQVVQQHAGGLLNGPSGACKISISYYNPITGQASSGVAGDIVQVSVVGYTYTPIALLKSGSPIPVAAVSSDVLEQCPLGGCPPIANPKPPTCP
ncbi:MAG: TadE family protein [Bryobacteraceae bacterium]